MGVQFTVTVQTLAGACIVQIRSTLTPACALREISLPAAVDRVGRPPMDGYAQSKQLRNGGDRCVCIDRMALHRERSTADCTLNTRLLHILISGRKSE